MGLTASFIPEWFSLEFESPAGNDEFLITNT